MKGLVQLWYQSGKDVQGRQAATGFCKPSLALRSIFLLVVVCLVGCAQCGPGRQTLGSLHLTETATRKAVVVDSSTVPKIPELLKPILDDNFTEPALAEPLE